MRFLIISLLAVNLSLGGSLKIFHYCGHIEVLSPNPMIPPGRVVGYVSVRGVEPSPPKTCVWVLFENIKGKDYLPTIVVESSSVDGYKVDLFSDSEFIYGYKGGKSLDFNRRGLKDRIVDMEIFLKNCAGTKVILKALRAYVEGKDEVEFRDFIEVVLPPSPATLPFTFSYESRHYIIPTNILPKLGVRYFLYNFSFEENIPSHLRKLVKEGREKALRHSFRFKPVKIPVSAVVK